MKDILDLIDHALLDDDSSVDAMRWRPGDQLDEPQLTIFANGVTGLSLMHEGRMFVAPLGSTFPGPSWIDLSGDLLGSTFPGPSWELV